jgi:hypothetical protein
MRPSRLNKPIRYPSNGPIRHPDAFAPAKPIAMRNSGTCAPRLRPLYAYTPLAIDVLRMVRLPESL